MNALPSFEPPEHQRQPQKSRRLQQPNGLGVANPSKRSRRSPVKLNRAYAHRRQGLEIVAKLVTYSTLSIFGTVTLVNSISYNWAQHSKLQHLETELQDAKIRTAKINNDFNRSFAPESQQNVMQENSYKTAPDRLGIFLVNSPGTSASPESIPLRSSEPQNPED